MQLHHLDLFKSVPSSVANGPIQDLFDHTKDSICFILESVPAGLANGLLQDFFENVQDYLEPHPFWLGSSPRNQIVVSFVVENTKSGLS